MLFMVLAAAGPAKAQASFDRLLKASDEARNWLMYNGTYASQHYSVLDQITPANVQDLELKWVWQALSLEKLETTPLVVDGVMYATEPPNNIVAIDTRTGRVFWKYEYPTPAVTYACCGRINRGLAILDHTLYMGTLDARLVAIDTRTGRKKWDVVVAEHTHGYVLAHAPLVVKDKVIVGPAGGEMGIKGFLAAYDTKTGRLIWKFNTVPNPGEPGHETWAGESWKNGGGSVWVTGSYDPDLNLTYWGIGNPGPDWNPAARPGDNLYTNSVVALDVDTGKLKWHFQFTPHDEWDWDAAQVPVLVDREWRGKPRKLMLWGNRNGFFYVLDRATGEFLLGKPFVRQDWAKGLDDKGRPIKIPGKGPSLHGTQVYPGVQGGTNWYAPSFSPRTGLFYLTAWDEYHSRYYTWDQTYKPGRNYTGGTTRADVPPTRRGLIRLWGPEAGYGALRALDPATGEKAWDFRTDDMSDSGVLTTAADLLFWGNREGYIFALDARSGKLLWKRQLGGQVAASPVTYLVEGKQHVSLASGNALFTFALR
jgi:alcohol dehydrogenase (cytochrome c)